MEGLIIGLTTSIMIIFITFLWTQALKVSDVMDNVETKMEEVVKTFNESNKLIEERVSNLENKEELITYKESVPNILSYPPSPSPIVEVDAMIEQQELPQLQQYDRVWKK